MRRDSTSRQNQWVDFVEEETKVRKNLSRLIHTVQHMPTARYRRDARSLWNLVGELESFQPPNSSRSVNSSQNTARKSFSRKYLDLRLYPSRERSISPETSLKCQKEEKKPQPFTSNKSKNNFKNEMKKIDPGSNVGANSANTSHGKNPNKKVKTLGIKNCKENILPENDNKNKSGPMEKQVNSELKGSHFRPRGRIQRFQLRRKSQERNMSRSNNSAEQFCKEHNNISSIQENSLPANVKLCKNKNFDKTKGRKKPNYMKNESNFANQLNETLANSLFIEAPLENDQDSMVKKLTSYWNNLLSDEVDDNDFSSSHDSSDVPNINKSLQDLARSIYDNTKDGQRNPRQRGRRPESRVNIFKRFETFHGSSDISKHNTENEEQFLKCLSEILPNSDLSNINHNKFLPSKEESLSVEEDVSTKQYLLEVSYDKSCGDNQNVELVHKVKCHSRFEQGFELKAQHAIEVMEKLLRKLKRFTELSLISDQITLSHSLRTMLCLLTATVMSSEEQLFKDDLLDSEVGLAKDISSKVDFRLPSDCVESSHVSLKETLDHNTVVGHDDLQLVQFQGITLRQVEDALRYLTLCKDYLWTEFLFSPRFSEEGAYSQGSKEFSPRSFTFVIEEELMFGGECDEEFIFGDESEDEEDENESTMEDIYRSVFDHGLVSLERVTDFVADVIVHYWPDSVEGSVRTMYQALVSLLVWWVLMKEIFYE